MNHILCFYFMLKVKSKLTMLEVDMYIINPK